MMYNQFVGNFAKMFARVSLFVIYFWFGLLKVLDKSPASPLVTALSDEIVPAALQPNLLLYLGIFEMLIGVLFLWPRFRKVVLVLFALHMLMVFAPFFYTPELLWQSAGAPTLEGQYIIKNIALIALVLTL